ncbi:prolipoprotein diacylglyceryl transferase [Polymorphum gilvum]|uniref:Phosphatidylglycerol--prolipoprotein diacylglyceryl transferase n=1 Tax=Polymorphum gilvum (strain LMG 25793 / CGMCC 1.9160 / SL003B-26A1) TaxID=991905 RepID=F2J0F7_POLGS|nr:prolipoprotein diacylglyceryl transferase [Polymorphum gilvum]ADZ69625.1 Prolipoprotein diacylglyceryl transferase [Polymorphum gilvum SL003B-26A1]
MPMLALPFPTIDPVLIEIGPFALRWYALSYIVGILLAWRYMRAAATNDRLWGTAPRPSPADIDDFVMWGTIGIVVGGRLGYVLFYNPAYYLAHPLEAFAVWTGGMSFHGGFAGTVIAMVLFTRARRFPVWTLFDLAGIAAPIGLFFGRLANFINGELWGRITDVPWGVVFPTGGPEPRHPSQLYEAALEGVLLFFVLRLLSHRFGLLCRPAFLAGAFAFGYGVTRSVSELFRMPDAHIGFFAGGLTMGIVLSVPMILAGLAAMLWAWRRSDAR